MKCLRSAFNAHYSRLIIVALQVGAVKIGQSNPAPWLHQFRLSSSQLLDLLRALRLPHFFFPLAYFKSTHKKNIFVCPSISNPDYLLDFASTYFHPAKNPKTCCHSNITIVVCRREEHCSSQNLSVSVVIVIIRFWRKGHCCSLVLEQRSY